MIKRYHGDHARSIRVVWFLEERGLGLARPDPVPVHS